jgi:hypothetical protein
MNQIIFLLFAAAGKAGQPGDKVAAEGGGFEWPGLVVVAVAAILISLAYWLLRRWRMARAQQLQNSPAHLLQELCVRHGLGGPAQRLLAVLAREQMLEHPATLFVDPRMWEASRLGATGKHHAAQLDRLRGQIFGTGR